jgi:hypothetical protein
VKRTLVLLVVLAMTAIVATTALAADENGIRPFRGNNRPLGYLIAADENGVRPN